NDDNTHAVALEVAPDARIVYVDNDPIVLSHAHALLGRGDGSTAYVQGDLRRPDEILERAAATLDLGKPVGLVLVGILHVIAEADRPHECVARLVDALAPGSYVAISHIVDRADEGDIRLLAERLNERMRDNYPATPRSPEDIRRFFDGLELVEPGLVPVPEWRPDGCAATRGRRATAILGGVPRKPRRHPPPSRQRALGGTGSPRESRLTLAANGDSGVHRDRCRRGGTVAARRWGRGGAPAATRRTRAGRRG